MIKAIIPARGGSKSIIKKNLVNLNGCPLITWTIKAAQNSKFIDEVWVSTEDNDIAKVSQSLGAKILMRPAELANDVSTSESALLHFHENIQYDIMVFIQATSPLITSQDIDKGIDKLLKDNLDSIFSVTRKHWIPTWSMDLKPIEWNIETRPRRQDKPEVYEENGAFYITTRNQFDKTKVRYGGKIGVVEIPLLRSFQIDTIEDLDLIRRIK